MQVEQMARSMGFEVRASGFQSQRHDLLTGPPGARDSAPLPVLLAAPREVNATVEPPCAAQRLAGGAQWSNPTGKEGSVTLIPRFTDGETEAQQR